MTMKPADAPRRLYTRSGYTLVLFKGKIFGAKTDKCAFDPKLPVTVELLPSNGKRARLTVVQEHRDPALGVIRAEEIWSSVTLKREVRQPAAPPAPEPKPES